MGLRKDGSTFAMELAVGKSRSGGRPLFAGIVRDISERNKSEQERNSEAKTRAILETAVDGIITIDPQGMILTANPATERIFGYRIDEMVGHKVNMLMPDPYRSAHDSYLERYLTTGERRIIGIGREVHGERKDGSIFPMELSVGEAMIGVPASSPASCATSPNANEPRRTCAPLRTRPTARGLAQSKVPGSSHDLRQPVQALTLFTSALAAKITGAPASALIEDMRGSVEALDMLLDAMLDVSSLDAGIIVPHETTFSATSSNGWSPNSNLRPVRRKSASAWCQARRSSGQTRRCSTEFCRISCPMRCATPARAAS